MNKLLDCLKKDPTVYYIYRSGPSIFGVECEHDEYLVITSSDHDITKYDLDDNFEQDEQNITFKGSKFRFRDTAWFFERIQKNDLNTLILKSLPKKDVIKEFVKVPTVVDSERIRGNVRASQFHMARTFAIQDPVSPGILSASKFCAFEFIKCIELSNQIREFGKIINLSVLKSHYEDVQNCKTMNEIKAYIDQYEKNNLS